MSNNRSSNETQSATQNWGLIIAVFVTIMAVFALYRVIIGAHQQMVETVAMNDAGSFSR